MKAIKILLLFVMLASSIGVNAQAGHGGNRLSKEQFMAELEKFITAEADLTPQECNKLFPIMREMYSKQRVYFDKMKGKKKKQPQTEAECREAVMMRDKIDIDIKKLQQTYHNKMLDAVSPCKVMKVIFAEDRFHRRMLKNWTRKDHK
ncbi:MAG: hypothetical protein ACI4T5_05570 [Prevotella sp.]